MLAPQLNKLNLLFDKKNKNIIQTKYTNKHTLKQIIIIMTKI